MILQQKISQWITNRAEGILPRYSVSLRFMYFFYFSAVGVFFPFLNVYFQSIGLSGTQIGIVNTLAPLVGIFGATLWGLFNDRFGKVRLLLIFAVSGLIVMVFGLYQIKTANLLWIMLAVSLFSLFSSALPTSLDSTTMAMLGEKRGLYGTFRVFGTIGFLVTTFLIGFAIERFGLIAIFIGYAILLSLFVLAAQVLPDQPIRLTGSVWNGLGLLVRQPLWVLFAVNAFLLWFANAGTMNFMSLTIKAMGGSDSLVGISWTASALLEIPVMIISATLFKKVGTARLLATAEVIYTLRTLLFSLMPSPNWVPFINLLNGLAFSLFWLGSVTYANELAPQQLKATSQGILFSIMNLASMCGALTAGYLFEHAGFRGLFQVNTGFCILALVLFSLGQWVLHKRQLKNPN